MMRCMVCCLYFCEHVGVSTNGTESIPPLCCARCGITHNFCLNIPPHVGVCPQMANILPTKQANRRTNAPHHKTTYHIITNHNASTMTDERPSPSHHPHKYTHVMRSTKPGRLRLCSRSYQCLCISPRFQRTPSISLILSFVTMEHSLRNLNWNTKPVHQRDCGQSRILMF